jgi:plasmid stabilization system protein ParE
VKGLRVSADAERDLDDIWHYVATSSGSVERANKFVDAITQRLSILARSPKAGKLRAEIDLDLRGMLVGDYIVYYRGGKRCVIISRIIHGSREQEAAYQT